MIVDPETGGGAYMIEGKGNGAWWGGAVQGAALGLVLVMASFLAVVAVSGGLLIWIPVAALVVANILAVLNNLKSMDEKTAACYVGGLVTGLGVAGLFNVNAIVGRMLALFGMVGGYEIDTTYGKGCGA